MPDYVRSQGAQLHSLVAQLSDNQGPLDIPPGTTVIFGGHMLSTPEVRIGGQGVVIRAGAERDDPNRGLVRYDLASADVATPGFFYCQWKLTPPNSTTYALFPEDSAEVLLVLPAA